MAHRINQLKKINSTAFAGGAGRIITSMLDPRFIASTFALSNEQAGLFTVLNGRSERIARIYLGAIIAVNDGADPERLVKAAHQVRELMRKMSEIADVKMRSLTESLGQKVAELETEFDSMLEITKLKAPKWDGAVDQPMRNWLNKTTDFFEWKKAFQPKRRAEVAQILRALDGPNRLLPAEIEKSNVDSWMDTKSYFDKIAHHGAEAVEKEFFERMAYVEGVLHNKLNPKTFPNFDDLDAIIEEGERG